MKLFLTLLLSTFFFNAPAQTKNTASVQQGITFRLLPVAVIERVSAASPEINTEAKDSFANAESKQKWAVQLKRLTALNEQPYALFSTGNKNKYADGNLVASQLYTVSKP